MNANEILPAIPRQKVLTHEGKIKEIAFAFTWDGEIWGMTFPTNETYGWKAVKLSLCEPVPEEPSRFKVGDKVKSGQVYTTIIGVTEFSDYLSYRTDTGVDVHPENLRHATPQECKDYFN